jgi:hypothetical protein
MVRLARWIKHPFDVTVQCLHHANSREHRWAAVRRDNISDSIAVCRSGSADSFFGRPVM